MSKVDEVKAQGSYHYSEVAAAIIADALAELTAEIRRVGDIIEGDADGAARERAISLWSSGHGKHPDD